MKHTKKLLSLVLALALCMSLAVPAFAAEPDFTITGTTLQKYKGPGGDVIIPDGITAIANNAFSYSKTLTGVTMPDSVTSIGNSAFRSCGALTNVYFSNNVTSIGDYAFDGCSSLTSVSLPNSVTSIGTYAFGSCSSMKSLTLPNSLVSMGNWAFTRCSSLTDVYIPGSVSVIPQYAFSQCSSVKDIVICEGVTKIEANAFRGCSSVTSLTLPASLKQVGTAAFYDFTGLRDVYYGGSEEQWNSIQGMEGATTALFTPSVLDGADIHYDSPVPSTPDTPSTPAPAAVSVTVNGAAVVWTDAAPFIDENDRTMVPLRAVADALGLMVDWDGNAREAIFANVTLTIYFPIDKTTARTSDGQSIEMDTAAVIVNDRTYAPIRYLAEYFGYTVGWDGATKTVSIR